MKNLVRHTTQITGDAGTYLGRTVHPKKTQEVLHFSVAGTDEKKSKEKEAWIRMKNGAWGNRRHHKISIFENLPVIRFARCFIRSIRNETLKVMRWYKHVSRYINTPFVLSPQATY
jgi:hypothetical protein